MTKFIGKLRSTSQPGEKKVYSFIDQAFEGEKKTFCYFQPILGKKTPDFLLISPTFGVVIIEVKDYSSDYLLRVSDTDDWIISIFGESVRRPNPFNQLKSYWTLIRHRIDKETVFRNHRSLIHQLLAFPNLSRKSEKAKEIVGVHRPNLSIIFKEDFKSVENFKDRFQQVFPMVLNLTNQNLSLLRNKLIISSRLPSPKQPRIYDYFPSVSVLKVLDEEQEKIAYNLGDGHRLFFGVAGSGKTVLLVARADFLARQHTDWRILILCFNRLLAKYLLKLIHPHEYPTHIEISNFHKWARKVILSKGSPYNTEYNTRYQQAKYSKGLSDFFSKEIPNLLNRIIQDDFISKYDAILLDEGQDFEPEWLKCLVQVLNPDTNSLLVTCDGLQGIYARKRFRWKHVGINAQGRTRKFRRSYRNPSRIGEMAYRFLVIDQELERLIETEEEFLEPREFARKGGIVDFRVFQNKEDEYESLANNIRKFIREKKSILLLFNRDLQKSNFNHPLISLFHEYNINWLNLKETGIEESGLFVGTLQGTKGLEADVVIIPELEKISSTTNKRQLIYVGMTRAIHSLVLTASGTNEFITNLQELFDVRKADPDLIDDVKKGHRCYFCKETKITGVDKPLCYNCWNRLSKQEICHYCGSSLSIDFREEILHSIEQTSFRMFSCQHCLNESYSYCKLCGEAITPEIGSPLCDSCFNTFLPVWSLASDKFFSKDIS